MPPLVTTVTARAASADRLADADYRDIYQEVRRYDPVTGDYGISLRAFVAMIGAAFPGQATLSIGYWSKYHNDQIGLTRRARNELRALVGQPQLPPTVGEAVAHADPDAIVYQVGASTPDRLILLGEDVDEPITLRVNGHVETLDTTPAPAGSAPVEDSAVTGVTSPSRPRKPSKAIRVSPASFERLSALRREAGMTWDELAAWVAELCGA